MKLLEGLRTNLNRAPTAILDLKPLTSMASFLRIHSYCFCPFDKAHFKYVVFVFVSCFLLLFCSVMIRRLNCLFICFVLFVCFVIIRRSFVCFTMNKEATELFFLLHK